MSGFLGIVNFDGAPADREILCQLTNSLAFRGPDAQEVWVQGNVGFGHAMLKTTWEAEREIQPCSLDGTSWITADCRIDAREDLIRELINRGSAGVAEATDPELILHAWAAWGPDCIQHLIGDFAFAIWDVCNKRLFCARDHMGVKLLYYARKASCLIFGNTLNSLRLHPSISDRLNEVAIGDYLLFGYNLDRSTTSFEDIQCLPAAHTLMWSAGSELRIHRYWTLPIDPPLRLRRRRDYAEHFLDLLRTVVRDRLRANQVGVMMSGGLDSTAIAAIAKELIEGSPVELSTHTSGFDRLIPDRERYYAGIAAAYLGIPNQFHALDDHGFYESCRNGEIRSPDPAYIPEIGPRGGANLKAIARTARVALYGEGADNALHYEWKPYVGYEISRGHFGSLLVDALSFPFVFRQTPFYTRFVSSFSGALAKQPEPSPQDGFPVWLNSGFADRLGLRDRYESVRTNDWQGMRGQQSATHPVRRSSYESFSIPLWQFVFEWNDAGITGLPVEVRLPFADIRMLRYLLAVPVIPWCRGKYLLRRALRSRLPDEILDRPKTGLAIASAAWSQAGIPEKKFSTIRVADYIDTARLETVWNISPELLDINLRPLTLDFFLRGIR